MAWEEAVPKERVEERRVSRRERWDVESRTGVGVDVWKVLVRVLYVRERRRGVFAAY